MSNSGSLTFTGTTNTITLSGTIAGSIMMSSSTATSITLQGNTGGIFLTGASSSITVANTSASSISSAGGINTNSGYYLNGLLLTFSSLPTTLGLDAASQCLSMDSNGISRIPSGSLTSTQLKFFNNTSLRSSIRLYRASDTTPLIIGDQIDGSTSTNRQYPIVSVISCVNTSQPVAGISATTASLLDVQFNDIGFGQIDYNIGFSVGFTTPFIGGFPNIQTMTSTGLALNIVANSSNGLASTGNFLIDGSNNRFLFNTLTPTTNFSSTINSSLYINGFTGISGSLVLGTQTSNNSDWITAMTSSIGNGTNKSIRLGQGLSSNNSFSMSYNHSSSGSTANYLSFQTYGLSNSLVITAGGWVGIQNTAPSCPFHVSATTSYQAQPNTGIQYQLLTAIADTFPVGPSASYNTSAIFSGALVCASISIISDLRLKQDIGDIPSKVIDIFENLEAKSYRYTNNLTKFEIGFIAQDLIKVGLGELIHKIPNEEMKKETEFDEDGVQLQINYESMIPLLQTSIKRLLIKVDIMIEIIEKQESRIKYLESLICDNHPCKLI